MDELPNMELAIPSKLPAGTGNVLSTRLPEMYVATIVYDPDICRKEDAATVDIGIPTGLT